MKWFVSSPRLLKNTRKYAIEWTQIEHAGVVSPKMRVSWRNNISRRECDCNKIADVYDTQDKNCRLSGKVVI